MSIIITICFLWSCAGGVICCCWNYYKYTEGWELYNPYWAYRYYTSVNWFGAIMISMVYTALCPIGAMCYWFYKLCTIGRK